MSWAKFGPQAVVGQLLFTWSRMVSPIRPAVVAGCCLGILVPLSKASDPLGGWTNFHSWPFLGSIPTGGKAEAARTLEAQTIGHTESTLLYFLSQSKSQVLPRLKECENRLHFLIGGAVKYWGCDFQSTTSNCYWLNCVSPKVGPYLQKRSHSEILGLRF